MPRGASVTHTKAYAMVTSEHVVHTWDVPSQSHLRNTTIHKVEFKAKYSGLKKKLYSAQY